MTVTKTNANKRFSFCSASYDDFLNQTKSSFIITTKRYPNKIFKAKCPFLSNV